MGEGLDFDILLQAEERHSRASGPRRKSGAAPCPAAQCRAGIRRGIRGFLSDAAQLERICLPELNYETRALHAGSQPTRISHAVLRGIGRLGLVLDAASLRA